MRKTIKNEIVSFFWWNVSLAPLGNEKNLSADDLSDCIHLMCELVKERKIDFFCLGEVGERLVHGLEEALADTSYRVVTGVVQEKKVKFDTCTVYDASKYELVYSEVILSTHVESWQKVAQKICYKSIPAGDELYLYVLHWPSKIRHGVDSDYRTSLGSSLRSSLKEVFDSRSEKANIVVLGDFNDEPYNKSMNIWLKSSRDRDYVIKRPDTLYNPFWQFLPATKKYTYTQSSGLCQATYKYSSTTQVTENYIFDQMLFSSSYMGVGPWHLKEESVKIPDEADVDFGKYIVEIGSDHLPIYAEIERVSTDG